MFHRTRECSSNPNNWDVESSNPLRNESTDSDGQFATISSLPAYSEDSEELELIYMQNMIRFIQSMVDREKQRTKPLLPSERIPN